MGGGDGVGDGDGEGVGDGDGEGVGAGAAQAAIRESAASTKTIEILPTSVNVFRLFIQNLL